MGENTGRAARLKGVQNKPLEKLEIEDEREDETDQEVENGQDIDRGADA